MIFRDSKQLEHQLKSYNLLSAVVRLSMVVKADVTKRLGTRKGRRSLDTAGLCMEYGNSAQHITVH